MSCSRLQADRMWNPQYRALKTVSVYPTDWRIRLATPNPGNVARPHVRETHGIARIDPATLVDEEQKRLSNMPREVEKSIRKGPKVEKVC